MTRSKAKDNALKLSVIKKQDKNYQLKETFEFEDGKILKFFVHFRPSKIEEMLEEMAKQLNYANEKGIELEDKFIFNYVHFLCIKYFTDLGKDIADDFETQLKQMEWLVDCKYFKPMVEEMFLKEELQKVWDKMTDVLSRYQLLEKLTIEAQNKLKNLELKNRDVFEKLGQIGNNIVQ
jgi:hypothetical protein